MQRDREGGFSDVVYNHSKSIAIKILKENSLPNIYEIVFHKYVKSKYINTSSDVYFNTRLNRFCIQQRLLLPFNEFNQTFKYKYDNKKLYNKFLFYNLCGLKALHDNGIVHGDIRGPNILVNLNDTTCYLNDYTFTRTIKDDSEGIRVGVGIYKSLESLLSKYTLESDIWSLGITYLRCICNHHKDFKFDIIFDSKISNKSLGILALILKYCIATKQIKHKHSSITNLLSKYNNKQTSDKLVNIVYKLITNNNVQVHLPSRFVDKRVGIYRVLNSMLQLHNRPNVDKLLIDKFFDSYDKDNDNYKIEGIDKLEEFFNSSPTDLGISKEYYCMNTKDDMNEDIVNYIIDTLELELNETDL